MWNIPSDASDYTTTADRDSEIVKPISERFLKLSIHCALKKQSLWKV